MLDSADPGEGNATDGRRQLLAVPTVDDLIESARCSAFGLQPQPIQSKREQQKPVLVILVGDPSQIEPLLIDWLVEAAVLCGVKRGQVDRGVLACPSKSLSIPDFVISAALDRRAQLLVRSTLQMVQMTSDKQLRVLHKEGFKHLVGNLTSALQRAWEYLEHEVYPKPSRNQFRQTVHRLLPTRFELFGSSHPLVHGLIVLAWGEQRPTQVGFMSEVSRRLAGCIMVTPGSTSMSARWLQLQESSRPGRRLRVETDDEIDNLDDDVETEDFAPSRLAKKSRPKATTLPWMSNEHLTRVEKQYRRKGRFAETKLGKKERQLERVQAAIIPEQPPEKAVVIVTPRTKAQAKLEEQARRLRRERRMLRRKLTFLVFVAERRRRQAKKELRQRN